MSHNHQKLAYVVSRFPKLSETFVLREIEALEERGWTVELLPFFRTREAVHHPAADRWVQRLGKRDTWTDLAAAHTFWLTRQPARLLGIYLLVLCQFWHQPRQLVRALVAVARATHWARRVQTNGIEHVHAHFGRVHTTMAALTISRLTVASCSVTCHGNEVYQSSAPQRALWRRTAFVVAISRLVHEQCANAIDRQHLQLVRCGVELGRFPFKARGEGKGRILAVARLTPFKGLTCLIDACALLRDRGRAFECRIIGDGPLLATLQAQIQRLHLEDRVHLDGARTDEEVRAALEQSSLFVLPSIQLADGTMEGVPVSLMEAMATGVPVISTRTGAIPELVENEHNGLLVPPENAEALASAIVRLSSDTALAQRLAGSARGRVEEEFDLEKNVGLLASLFDSAITECATV